MIIGSARASSMDKVPALTSLMPTYRPADVRFVRGSGSELFDCDGKRYIDLLCGIAVTSLGHCHPVVSDAISEQAHRLMHLSNLYRNPIAEEVAGLLDLLIGGGGLPAPGGKVFFGNSGAEANECAIKLTRRFHGGARHVIVSALGSFHGRTLATLHATGQPHKHEPFQPLPEGFRHVPYDDVTALEAAMAPDVGGVLLESIEGEGGVVVPSPGYLAEARRVCDEHGALLIVDEIQTGLGRTGRWFGFQHDLVAPDIVTVAKALGNGMPIGACWARPEVAAAFQPGDHGSTFGGQPLACAAARAVLRVMISEDVPARADSLGVLLRQRLCGLPGVETVRGRGLLAGAVLAEALSATQVASAALRHGLVVNATDEHVLRLAPSLLIEQAVLEEGLELLGDALDEVAQGVGS